jgi:hypothetical protein
VAQVKATTPGVCAVCGKTYPVGTELRRDPADRTKLAHKICGRRQARRKRLGF